MGELEIVLIVCIFLVLNEQNPERSVATGDQSGVWSRQSKAKNLKNFCFYENHRILAVERG
jgi:hypothetical protein